MSVTLVLPGQLRDVARGSASLEIPGRPTTLAAAFRSLRSGWPGVHDRILTEQGELRPHVNVFVDQEDIRWSGGLDTPLEEDSEVMVLPAVSGG